MEDTWWLAMIFGLPVVYWLYCVFVAGPKHAQQERQEWQLARAQALRDLSLNCNSCGALAAPIPNTNNRYRCDKCGRQFTGSCHRL